MTLRKKSSPKRKLGVFVNSGNNYLVTWQEDRQSPSRTRKADRVDQFDGNVTYRWCAGSASDVERVK